MMGIAMVESVFSEQGLKEKDLVLCFKVVVKEPTSFYGNPGDQFSLYDGTKWKVQSAGYEYIPLRYTDGLMCPAVEKFIVGNKVMLVLKQN